MYVVQLIMMIAVMASEITIVIPTNALDLYVLVTGYLLYGTVVYSYRELR